MIKVLMWLMGQIGEKIQNQIQVFYKTVFKVLKNNESKIMPLKIFNIE